MDANFKDINAALEAFETELKAQQKLHALTDSAAETERRAAASRRSADAAVLELGAAQDSLRRWYAATYEDPPVPSLKGDANAAAALLLAAGADPDARNIVDDGNTPLLYAVRPAIAIAWPRLASPRLAIVPSCHRAVAMLGR